VLTPSFEQAAWLPQNLASVACQTYPHVEHIVMDGGSTDDSIEILEASVDSVMWRSEPDRGQSHAINKALEASRGQIIGWINSDDAYFDCQVIADVVEYFAAHPDVDVVYGHCAQITAEGRFIQILWAPPFDPDLLLAVNPIMQPATFMRRSALETPMLDESFDFAMDYELWLRLLREGRRFARIDRITAVDRHHGKRKSRTIKDVNTADLERLRKMYDTHPGPPYDRRRSAFYVRQRLMGGLLIPRVHGPFAFDVPHGAKQGLLRRHVLQRRRDWPSEYR